MKIRKIVLAPDTRIQMNRDQVDRVLEILGHPEALVTDESTVADFLFDEGDLANITDRIGFPVHMEDYVWELAEKLED